MNCQICQPLLTNLHALIFLSGCNKNSDCKNGGECKNNKCKCPKSYHGNRCQYSKPTTRSFGNRNGEPLLCVMLFSPTPMFFGKSIDWSYEFSKSSSHAIECQDNTDCFRGEKCIRLNGRKRCRCGTERDINIKCDRGFTCSSYNSRCVPSSKRSNRSAGRRCNSSSECRWSEKCNKDKNRCVPRNRKLVSVTYVPNK